jgi:hypothetical protein
LLYKVKDNRGKSINEKVIRFVREVQGMLTQNSPEVHAINPPEVIL